MKSKAFCLAFPRQSRLATFLSLAITASLLTPLVPGAFSAGAPAPAPRAVAQPAAFAVAPLITATKADAFPDPDNDGKAVPGDTITYTVQVNNSGTDATGVVFNDTVDANTTFVPGSVTTTPVAVDDTYSAVGNVRISVPAANGLTSNDPDPDGGAVTAVPGSTTSAQGGEVTVNADGSFTYNPPAGFEGADTFTYTINGAAAPSNTSTVTVNVSGMIWFIDDSAAPGGDGRLTSPFDSIAAFEAGAADQQNDNIFLYSGNYTGGLTLLSGQALIGEGANASLATVTGITPPAYSDPLPATGGADPVVGGASGISLATNNLIRGLTLANTAGAGISGTAFGTLAVADTTVNSTAQALNLDTGALNAQFDAVSVGGRTTTGILLNSVGGTATFGPTSIPNPLNSGGYGIRVTNSTAVITVASATISDSSQVVSQTDANLDGIPDSAFNSDGDAISLVNNTGSFTLNGGALSNCGNNCVSVRDSQNLTLSGVTISTPGVNVAPAAAAGLGGHGVQAINLTGTNSIAGSTVTAFSGANHQGVRFINNVPTPSTLTVTGTTFSNSPTGGDGLFVNGLDAAQMAVTVGGPTNNVATNSTFTGLFGAAITHAAGANVGSTATVNLTVQNSTFNNAATNGRNTVSARVLEGGKANVVFSGNTFDNVARVASSNTGVITVNGDGTLAGNQLSVNVSGNTVTNIGTATLAGYRGIQVFIDDHTNVSGTVVVDGNTLTNLRRDGLFLDFANGVNGTDVNARVTNNTVGTDAARVGLAGQSGIRIFSRCFPVGTACGRSANVLVEDNSVRNGNGIVASAVNAVGLFARAEDNASLNLTVLGNDIETNSTGSTPVATPAEARFDTSFGVGAGPTLCLDMGGSGGAGEANILAAGAGQITLNEAAGALNVEQASAAALAAANGIPAANVVLLGASTPQFGVSCAAPPVAMFRTNARAEYLAALAPLSGPRFEVITGIDSWLTNSKSRLGGLSYRNAPASVALTSGLTDTAVRPARTVVAEPLAARAAAAPLFSGETVNVNIGTLPAGKSMTITFQVTIDGTINVPQVSNQGTVSGSNFAPVVTDDPATGAFGDPTVTPVFLGTPPDISCPADISVGTDPGVSTASVAFNVTATGTPAPTVDCKVGATSITSPHTFQLGETTVVCTATNGVEPDDSCSFKVTVTDDEAPVIDCPADIVVSLPPNSSATTQTVNFTVTATDNADATPTISTDFPSGYAFPVGTTTVTATATDDAGNQSTCQFNVTVLYNFTGFFSPVSNPPVLNEVKAGQNIPVKFSLGGNKGLNIFFPGYPMSQQINCADNAPINVLEETNTAGGSSLSYNAATGTYQYNWKTEKSWAGTCRVLVVKLADGTEHVAYFKFK